MTFKNQNTYIGEWSNDTENGKGTFIFNSGDKYNGEIKNSLFKWGLI